MTDHPLTIPDDFPWPDDKIEGHGVHKGIPWVARRVEWPTGGWVVNGYARLPDGHPWIEQDMEAETGVPFGSLTYNDCTWVGFDTNHAGQWWPGDWRRRFPGDRVMDVPTVVAWAELLAINAADAMPDD